MNPVFFLLLSCEEILLHTKDAKLLSRENSHLNGEIGSGLSSFKNYLNYSVS